MQLKIAYTIEGQTTEVTTNPFAVMQWERRYKTKISRISHDGLGIEDLLFLCWEAIKAQGTTVAPFEVWAAVVETVTTVADDDAVPTRPAPSAG
jgi:hypothetical protein